MSIEIGRIYIERVSGESRLSARIKVHGRENVLYFGLDSQKEHYLCAERSDAFILALLPMAMRYGEDIVFETPASRRLCYLLDSYLIQSFASLGSRYKRMALKGPVADRKIENLRGVGTGFSAGVDSLFSIYAHQEDSLYPVTHLAVFNMGVIETGDKHAKFRSIAAGAERFADEYGYELVPLDSNISDILPERFLDVYSFRNLAGALALQGIFSVYYLSSGSDYGNFQMAIDDVANCDLVTVASVQTESLAVYNSGAESLRVEKIEALSLWEPSYKWLHPCMYSSILRKNCGSCFKCVRDMTTLYALGRLERYSAVFDIEDYYKMLPQRIGLVLANDKTHFYLSARKLLLESGAYIPPAAYKWEEMFRRSWKNIREAQDENR